MKTLPDVNLERLLHRIEQLGCIGALKGGGVCRLALTEEDRAARDLVIEWMRELGLTVSIDHIGNIFGSRDARQDSPPVMIGSHIDTVRTGGLYDGALGVLAGLEVVATLNDGAVVTDRPVAVAAFTNEEGARFAPDMMGSLVYVGGLDSDEALATVGIDGETVGNGLRGIGYAGDMHAVGPSVHAFVELHVEQGPILEEEGIAIGVVEGVQGISWTELIITGSSAHAGTTPMHLRKDASQAAAAIIVGLREIASQGSGNQLATVGAMTLEPNLVNVVPERARMTIDLRNPIEGELRHAECALDRLICEVAEANGAHRGDRCHVRHAR